MDVDQSSCWSSWYTSFEGCAYARGIGQVAEWRFDRSNARQLRLRQFRESKAECAMGRVWDSEDEGRHRSVEGGCIDLLLEVREE